MSLVVVGSVAYDAIETPYGKRERALGGACTYIALSASYFVKPSIVAVVGEDFANEDRSLLSSKGVDLDVQGRRADSGDDLRQRRTARDCVDCIAGVVGDNAVGADAEAAGAATRDLAITRSGERDSTASCERGAAIGGKAHGAGGIRPTYVGGEGHAAAYRGRAARTRQHRARWQSVRRHEMMHRGLGRIEGPEIVSGRIQRVDLRTEGQRAQ